MPKKSPRIELYIADGPQPYRWRAVASNGRIVADSGEGYVTRASCRRAIKTAREAFLSGGIVEEKQGSTGVRV